MGPTEGVLYEPDEKCPLRLSVAVGFQGAILALTSTSLYLAVVAQAAGQGEEYLSWAVFAALVINGAVTALQASRLGRFGVGHVMITGTAPGFIAISLTALMEGGPATLASLIVISSLFQFALAAWLPLLRRVITPVVSGIALMLIAVTVIPIAVDRLNAASEGSATSASLVVAVATLGAATILGLRASGALRLWSLIIAIVVGCVVAALFGLYDAQRLIDAPWVGIPKIGLPGFDLRPGVEFWSLLPMFLIVAMATTVKVIGSSVVIQRVSQRSPRAPDFRLIQGAVNANGLGTLLSGIAGTLPTITYDAIGLSLVNFTGVTARSVGYVIGIVLVTLALLPKVTGLLLTIPNAVAAAYILIIMGLLLVEGMKTVVQDGLDHRKVLVVGVALSVGVGFHNQNVVAGLPGGAWSLLLSNGITVGTLAAVLMTSFMELTSPRRRRIEVALDIAALPKIDEFLSKLASDMGWNDDSTNRLRIVGEEVLSSLLQQEEDEANNSRRLTIVARPAGTTVELELLAAFEEQNIEDRIADMSVGTEMADEHDISFRLLQHYSSSVRHRKYHDIDVVTLQVEGSR